MESIQIALLGAFMVVLLYMSGWFSRAETAISLTSASQIASMQEEREDVTYLLSVKRDLNRTIVTILIGNNLVNILLSTIAALIANSLFKVWGVTIMVGILTFVIIIFGEITPKSHAVIDNRAVALRNSKKLYYMTKILSPVIDAFLWISQTILRLSGTNVDKRQMLVSDASIKNLATLGEQEGIIKPIEKEIIHNVFLFGDLKVRDIMLPKDGVITVPYGTDIKAALGILIENGYTRVPVMQCEKVIGVLYSKDLLSVSGGTILDKMRQPYIIFDDIDITSAFDGMRAARVHMGIVHNKENVFVGIVTLEDIIEELVGNIRDEYYEQHKKKKV